MAENNEGISEELQKKVENLKKYIAGLGSLAVGFSGGVDSSLLVAVAHEVLGDRLIAVTGADASVPERELNEAVAFCKERGIRHIVCNVDPLKEEGYRNNSPDRCYFCKHGIFTEVRKRVQVREHECNTEIIGRSSMSIVNEIQFAVEKSVLDIGVKIVFPVIEGMDNTLISPEWMEKRKEIIAHLLDEYIDIDYHADPILEGFHVLHDRAGVKRRKNIPASENLIRLLNKHGDVFFINQAVDIYNIISMESKLALGAHDIDHVDGNVTLRFTDGTERFVPIGQNEPVPNNPHEYSYCDDANEVLCRLEIRQVEKTKVDEQTKNVFYIVQGNEATDNDLLLTTARKIVDETIRYCGGKGRIIIPKII